MGDHGDTTRIGLISMGTTDRPDLLTDYDEVFGPETTVVAVGILDGLAKATIEATLAPAPGEPYIVSTIGDGTMVKVAEAKAKQLIQTRLDELREAGVERTIVACTGDFGEFDRAGLVFQPPKIVDGLFRALGVTRLGILVPEPIHVGMDEDLYAGFGPVVYAANPYEDLALLSAQAARFRDTDVDLVFLDCMGYTAAMGELAREASGKPVLVARVLIAHTVCAFR
jgi:protein AroM